MLGWFRRIRMPSFPPAVLTIAAICVAVYVVQLLSARVLVDANVLLERKFIVHAGVPLSGVLSQSFGVYWPAMKSGAVWQPVTYAFLHGSFWHLFFNVFTILFFGAAVENYIGTGRFWRLFLFSVVVGGLGWMAIDIVEPRFWGWMASRTAPWCRSLAQRWGEHQPAGMVYGTCIGASAGVCGLIGAFATLFPRNIVQLFLFGIIPIKLQARFLALGYALVSIGGMVAASGHIAHSAHLVGLIAGFIWVRAYLRRYRSMYC